MDSLAPLRACSALPVISSDQSARGRPLTDQHRFVSPVHDGATYTGQPDLAMPPVPPRARSIRRQVHKGYLRSQCQVVVGICEMLPRINEVTATSARSADFTRHVETRSAPAGRKIGADAMEIKWKGSSMAAHKSRSAKGLRASHQTTSHGRPARRRFRRPPTPAGAVARVAPHRSAARSGSFSRRNTGQGDPDRCCLQDWGRISVAFGGEIDPASRFGCRGVALAPPWVALVLALRHKPLRIAKRGA